MASGAKALSLRSLTAGLKPRPSDSAIYKIASNNKERKSNHAVLAAVKQEMAKPRVAESAAIEILRQSMATTKEGAKP